MGTRGHSRFTPLSLLYSKASLNGALWPGSRRACSSLEHCRATALKEKGPSSAVHINLHLCSTVLSWSSSTKESCGEIFQLPHCLSSLNRRSFRYIPKRRESKMSSCYFFVPSGHQLKTYPAHIPSRNAVPRMKKLLWFLGP